ncbi:CLUMA CG011169 isoform A [Tupanvirus soda lake]|uniref:CLUMA CG011169 isoform A n=2 Tax=Tupanvirus TaxID=2094720 RepID=A0A6N1NWT9_9VIRU|nr:CLUMA CG011169 isoform A [Tupanvirus soda lake]QKU35738.1 CLUMA CG011169 isoform A [Tupanvirus soda lake]
MENKKLLPRKKIQKKVMVVTLQRDSSGAKRSSADLNEKDIFDINKPDRCARSDLFLGIRGHAATWIQQNFEEDDAKKHPIPKFQVYMDYVSFCIEKKYSYIRNAEFGKVLKKIFPHIKYHRYISLLDTKEIPPTANSGKKQISYYVGIKPKLNTLVVPEKIDLMGNTTETVQTVVPENEYFEIAPGYFEILPDRTKYEQNPETSTPFWDTPIPVIPAILPVVPIVNDHLEMCICIDCILVRLNKLAHDTNELVGEMICQYNDTVGMSQDYTVGMSQDYTVGMSQDYTDGHYNEDEFENMPRFNWQKQSNQMLFFNWQTKSDTRHIIDYNNIYDTSADIYLNLN